MMFKLYNREATLAYAQKWSLSRNPAYYDFTGIGGDCTNFISQCLYAGALVMNPTPTMGWYYYDVNHRSPSWTGVPFLYQFLTTSHALGPSAQEVSTLTQLLPGDIIQFGDTNKGWHHSVLVLNTGDTLDQIYIATHSDDAYNRPLTDYTFTKIRFLHIVGVYI